MRWLNREYLLKGAFLGLLLGAALAAPTWRAAGVVALGMLVGLAVALLVGVGQRLARGVRPAGRWGALLLLVLLESPTTIYAGLLFGLIAGVLTIPEVTGDVRIPIAVVGGMVFVGGLGALRQIGQPWRRILLAGLIAGLVVAAAVEWIENDLSMDAARRQ